jgi:hypothetical protein
MEYARNGTMNNTKVRYVICPKVSDYCTRKCSHSKVHAIKAGCAAFCEHLNITLDCREATTEEMVLARLTGKI